MSRRESAAVKGQREVAKVFWSGRSQAVRLPKSMRFDCETVSVRREGNSLRLEPIDEWPTPWVAQLRGPGVSADFERPPQGRIERRARVFR